MGSEQMRGAIVREQVIPAREYTAFEMTRGQVLRIIDLEGQQVTDVAAFSLEDLEERLNAETTKLIIGTIRPVKGHTLYSDDARPMFTITEDTVGINYLAAAVCSDEANVARYGAHGTRNCRDNLTRAVAPWGLRKRQIQGAFAPFLNVIHYPDGRVEIREPTSKPGDYLELRAEMDMLVAITNCPQEHNPCNAWKPTAVKILVAQPA